MTVAASRHRTFRTYLQAAFLTEGGEHYGKTPFDRYTFIEPEHWEEFQIQMGTPEAKALSEKNKDIQKKNPYLHYMARGGYAMLQHELAASQATAYADIAGLSTETGSQLRREDSWLRGHTPGRQTEVTDPALMEIRDRIVQLKKEVVAGTFVPDGHNDVLTRALWTAEHPWQTRGVGSYSGLRKVFIGNMKPRKPDGNYMTEEDLLQRLPSLLHQYGLSVFEGAPDFASMSQHTPYVTPHYGQHSSKASTDFFDFVDVTEVAACYLKISDPADYIVAHGSIFPRAPGDMMHGVPLLLHQHIETVADCEGSFVAWPKQLVGLVDPSVHTARHGDFSSSKSHPILGVRPTAPSSPIQDVVDRSSYVSFGPMCRELCLGGYFGNGTCLSLKLDRIGLMFSEYPNK
ncbi:unnamed protein product [Cuscuta campestris]|uniref:Uncharacterized protein n=1 Tax=Cuscuta campestris TaxID=132261 RepID=A0A484NQJ7_9ASTE|nr:unnamed protein product [Cuscuta campestris]